MKLPVLAALGCASLLAAWPAAAQPAGQGHGIVVPRTPHRRIVRPDAARVQFMREHPCPATGQFTTDCPGWRVEYVVPLERGGTDTADNMKWERTDLARPAD